MKWSRVLAAALALLAATVIWGDEEKKLVTVFPFRASGISETEADTLTGLFETGLVNTLLVRVVDQTERAKLLEAVEEIIADYVDEKCAVEIGKQLAADNVFLGKAEETLCEMILVEGGSFEMGCASGNSDEEPVHTVRVSGFFMAAHEMTQAQWQEVMGSNPSYWKGNDLPVQQVSWYDAVAFCNVLSEREGLTAAYTIRGDTVTWNTSADGYRLPTEAEWEYAARGGSKSRGYTYSGSNSATDVGWYKDNARSTTHAVGEKAANELGLCDMSGNVWEWCWDWMGSYSSSSQTDPRGPSTGKHRVLRGGSWVCRATNLRAVVRLIGTPTDRNYYVGFRVVRAAR